MNSLIKLSTITVRSYGFYMITASVLKGLSSYNVKSLTYFYVKIKILTNFHIRIFVAFNYSLNACSIHYVVFTSI